MKFIYILLLISHIMLSAQAWVWVMENTSSTNCISNTCEISGNETEDTQEILELAVIPAIAYPAKNFTPLFSIQISSHLVLFFADITIPPPKHLQKISLHTNRHHTSLQLLHATQI
ncbi:hypothetical protein [Ascidiimonas aurantiaca]|uniref:hypothetical protein n=1 Tax=Ascidiimonas aurantiaca TaxID=1685432 RepID=UPI0030EC6D93